MTGTLTDSEKADLYAHIAMIEEVIRNAEVYSLFITAINKFIY
jgi:hypothetical protein